MTRFQVLVSTMNKSEQFELLNNMNLHSNAIIINQCTSEKKEVKRTKSNNLDWINSYERGLSRSRNMAIDNATGEICILADDDLIYVEHLEKLVLDAFDRNPDADIITFQVEGIDKKFKQYYSKERSLNFLTSLKVASVEVAFRLNSIKNNSIQFKEEFGAGSKYRMGEENIFIYDCLKKGLKIKYIPLKIADLYVGDSTWFNGYNEKYFSDLGAVYSAMSKRYSYILILQFAIRKYSLYKNQVSLLNAIKNMLSGRSEYLKSAT